MAINLDHSIYGRQFAAFADFAKANESNPDALVRMGANEKPDELWDKDNNPRRIVVKDDGDAIRSWNKLFFRFGAKAECNDEVRNIFRNTILAVCGVNEMKDLPKPVLDVMNASDYNKGRPLSVRRIKAVTDAVKLFAQQQDAFKASQIEAACKPEGSVIEDRPVEVKEDHPVEVEPELDDEQAMKPVESLRERLGPGRAGIAPMSPDALANKVKSLYGDIPGYGDVVAAVATETTKAIDGFVAEHELEKISLDECEQLWEDAKQVDFTKEFSSMTTNVQNISDTLTRIRRKASDKFDKLYPYDGAPNLMREIKRNVFMNFALQHQDAYVAYGMDIKRVNTLLVGIHGQGEMLNLISPVFLKQNSGFDIRK